MYPPSTGIIPASSSGTSSARVRAAVAAGLGVARPRGSAVTLEVRVEGAKSALARAPEQGIGHAGERRHHDHGPGAAVRAHDRGYTPTGGGVLDRGAAELEDRGRWAVARGALHRPFSLPERHPAVKRRPCRLPGGRSMFPVAPRGARRRERPVIHHWPRRYPNGPSSRETFTNGR